MRARNNKTIVAVSVLALMILAVPAFSAVPGLISFQGRIVDINHMPVPDGSYTLTFSLYTTETNETAEWTESQQVEIENGIYQVELGAVTPFPVEIGTLFNDPLYLGVMVHPDTTEMAPRQRLTSTPFALRAAVADDVEDGVVGTAHLMDNAVTGVKIDNGTVAAADLEDGATLNEIRDDDGEGSGLDADRLDGFSSGAFVQATQDYGRSGVAFNLYEGTNTLVSKYVNQSGDTMTGALSVPSLSIDGTTVLEADIYNTFVGFGAGEAITSGLNNTFLGYLSGNHTTDGNNNTFIGSYAGNHTTDGYHNTFIGTYAGYWSTTGHHNTCIGLNTGYNNAGDYNTFLGIAAGYDNEGDYNTFIGFDAGIGNTSGDENSFLGSYAGHSNTTGYYNTFLGRSAGYANTIGNFNVFVGYEAGGENSAGEANTFLGDRAGSENITGDFNTFIGRQAGSGNTTGYENTYLGRSAGGGNSAGYRNVCIGNSAGYFETGSYKLYIDNSSTSDPLIWGDFSDERVAIHGKLGVGTKDPVHNLHVIGDEIYTSGENAGFKFHDRGGTVNSYWVWYSDLNAARLFRRGHGDVIEFNPNGNVAIGTSSWGGYTLAVNGSAAKTDGGSWSTLSDGRLKDVSGSYDAGLDAVTRLRPVKFRYKQANPLNLPTEEEYVGLVAQEVRELIPEAVEENADGYLLINESPINYAMLNAIKELRSEVEQLRQRIAELEQDRSS